MILATLIEGKELLQTVVASTVAGIGVTVAFSVAIWGAAQFAELSRAERPLAAGLAGAVGVLALVVVAAALVVGVIVMTSS
jgi:formate/nitrite transporter FocA (FNT family)